MHTASNDTGTTSAWDAVFAWHNNAYPSPEAWAALVRRFVGTAREHGWPVIAITHFTEALLRERGYTLKELQDGTKVWRS